MVSIYREGGDPIRATSLRVPTILHTTQEARYLGLKYYKLVFQELLSAKAGYFNFALDTLNPEFNVLEPQEYDADEPPNLAELNKTYPHLRYLAVDDYWLDLYIPALYNFKNLQQLILMTFAEFEKAADFSSWTEEETEKHNSILTKWKNKSQLVTIPIIRTVSFDSFFEVCNCQITNPSSLQVFVVTGEIPGATSGFGSLLGHEHEFDFAIQRLNARSKEKKEQVNALWDISLASKGECCLVFSETNL